MRARGVTVEEAPSLDFSQDDGSTLRVMANRSQVDTVAVSEGRVADAPGEVLLERLYATSRGISVGDVIKVGGQELTVVGIGTSPDYDLCMASMADLVADPSTFGCAFVTGRQYASLRDAGQAQSAEETRYLFRLPSDVSVESLRDQVRDFKASLDQAGDPAFAAYLDERLAERRRIIGVPTTRPRDSLDEIREAAGRLLPRARTGPVLRHRWCVTARRCGPRLPGHVGRAA